MECISKLRTMHTKQKIHKQTIGSPSRDGIALIRQVEKNRRKRESRQWR